MCVSLILPGKFRYFYGQCHSTATIPFEPILSAVFFCLLFIPFSVSIQFDFISFLSVALRDFRTLWNSWIIDKTHTHSHHMCRRSREQASKRAWVSRAATNETEKYVGWLSIKTFNRIYLIPDVCRNIFGWKSIFDDAFFSKLIFNVTHTVRSFDFALPPRYSLDLAFPSIYSLKISIRLIIDTIIFFSLAPFHCFSFWR